MGLFDALVTPAPDVETMFREERGGASVSTEPHVFIATPAYNKPELAFLTSREQTVRDLNKHGVSTTVYMSSGDSLVTRGRHVLMYEFLKSTCTHMLFWDSDIECLDPTTVGQLIMTGHDVIGGACPFRDNSGRVVTNLLAEDRERKQISTDDHGCVRVSEVGTGFMMLRREAIVQLCMEHPELFYRADLPSYMDKPMWALFDTVIENERYLSEDYFFCKLWRETGGECHILASAEFRHYGTVGCEGSFMESLGMVEVP